jgi:hypothetical protein
MGVIVPMQTGMARLHEIGEWAAILNEATGGF